VHAGSAPVVRLEGPLALGHGVLLVVSSSKHLSHPTTSLIRRPGVVLLLAGAVSKTRHFGSQPYRRLSGDCLRVLTSLLRVKPGLPQWSRPNIV